MEEVILVDENDRETGVMEKMQAHRTGSLHRAFSVFIFNSAHEVLLHQRAAGKYHGPGLWTNACCSHPRPGESTPDAATRRLKEEMGISCPLEKLFDFTYRAEVGGGLIEHEFDHVFVGYSDSPPAPDKQEVMDWKWSPAEAIIKDLREEPASYTTWFAIAFPRVVEQAVLKNERT